MTGPKGNSEFVFPQTSISSRPATEGILLITNEAVNIPYPQLPAGFRCECIVGNVDPSWRAHMKSLRMLCRIMIKVMMTQELEKW